MTHSTCQKTFGQLLTTSSTRPTRHSGLPGRRTGTQPDLHSTVPSRPRTVAPDGPPKASGDNCFFPNPTKDNWYETVKLNYGFNFADGTSDFSARPRTWDVVDQIIASWQARGVNGFRCDMAYYVPRKAWEFLIGNCAGTRSGRLLPRRSVPDRRPRHPHPRPQRPDGRRFRRGLPLRRLQRPETDIPRFGVPG